MKIGIVGLGLIGGSLLKAIKKNTNYLCYGYNRTEQTLMQAQSLLDGRLELSNIKDMDILFLCIAPKAAIEFVEENIHLFSRDCIIIDVCGVKKYMVDSLEKICLEKGVIFLGGHPMAGREVNGFINSSAEMFVGASFILTPTESNYKVVAKIEKLILDIGFAIVVKVSPEEHDAIIAYTSQLAHIVSNAYVKSPTLKHSKGLSAGSFEDLTRVARLDSKMWTELFMLNKKNLLLELDVLLASLNEYRQALQAEDEGMLISLLEKGNQLKINS